MSRTHEEWSVGAARECLAEIDVPGPVLVALQALQERFGYVHQQAVALIAEFANVSRADVYGVLTYYADLRSTPPADVEVRVCLGEACQSVGARALLAEATTLAGPTIEVQHVYCLGNCALGPSATVNDRLIGLASSESVSAAIDRVRS